MTNQPTSSNRSALKRIVLLLLIVILVNPIILYLVTGKVWVSFLLPVLLGALVFFISGKRKLRLLNILLVNLLLVLSFFLHAEAIFTYRFSDHIIEDLYEVKGKYYF